MSKTNNGGPAFPQIDPDPSGDTPMYEGMSLRDYFACQVVGSLVQQYANNGIAEPERVSKRAYLYADAMLKARDKSGNKQLKTSPLRKPRMSA